MKRIALQLALPKIGIAWMFALLTSNFNRVTIFDLGITAIVVTLILGVYPLLAPVQPLFGRWIDRHPLFGYRRSPYLLLAMLGSGLIFPLLPWVARGLHIGDPLAVIAEIVLMVVFGLGIALIANTYLDLVAEVSDERSRGPIFATAWTAQTAAIVAWAFVFQWVMPDYTARSMQTLYNLTPFVTLGTTLLGIAGLEQRVRTSSAARVPAPIAPPVNNPIEALRALRENGPARVFFAFVFFCILGIFMQDAILEVYGAAVFKMSLGATSTFQQIWNGAVLVAMVITNILIGPRIAVIIGDTLPFKRRIAAAGGLASALSLGLLALSAIVAQPWMLYIALTLLGLSNGVFTAVTVTLMSDMTIAEATGRYLGLWSMAQAFATSAAFVVSGVLYSALIESRLFPSTSGFAVIFLVEALLMGVGVLLLQLVSVAGFRGVARRALVVTGN